MCHGPLQESKKQQYWEREGRAETPREEVPRFQSQKVWLQTQLPYFPAGEMLSTLSPCFFILQMGMFVMRIDDTENMHNVTHLTGMPEGGKGQTSGRAVQLPAKDSTSHPRGLGPSAPLSTPASC